jgi:DNA-directed RNA polymerase subunit N (RpoN/RPB10)
MEITQCFECGATISDKWEAFKFMQDLVIRKEDASQTSRVHVDKRAIDPGQNSNLIPIFDALRIEKYCCRSKFTSSRIMSELRS